MDNFKKLLEDAGGGTWVQNLAEGTETLSPLLATILGYQPQELGSHPGAFEQLIHVHDLGRFRQALQAHIQSMGKTPVKEELRFIHKNNGESWLLCSCRVSAWDRPGIPARIEGLCLDIDRQKQNESKLLAEQQELARFFDLSPDLLCIANSEGRFIRVNKAWEEMLGYPAELLENSRFLDFVHPADVEITIEAMEKLGNQIPVRAFVNRYRAKSGNYHYIEWQSQPFGSMIYAAARDISWRVGSEQHILEKQQELLASEEELKASVEELTASNEKLKAVQDELMKQNTFKKAVLQSAGPMIITTDLSGCITTFNANAEKALGFKAEELIGTHTPEVFHERSEIIWRAELLSSELGREVIPGFRVFVEKADLEIPEQLEWTYVRKDKTTFPVLLSVTAIMGHDKAPIGYVGIAFDISKRKKIQAELQRATLLLNEAQHLARLGGWELDAITGETVWTDEVYRIHEVENDFPHNAANGPRFYHPDDRPIVANALKKALEDAEPFDITCRFVTAKGNNRWVRASGRPILDGSGKVISVSGMFQDITTQKETELALKKNLEMINRQNERLLNFAFIVSHNLRTHSRNISTLLGMLDQGGDSGFISEIMEHLRSASQKLTETVANLNEVVDFSTKLDNTRKTLNLHSQIERAVETVKVDIALNNAKVVNRVPKDLEFGYSAAYMESILLNFLTNGIKYRHPDRPPEIVFTSSEENGRLALEVSDNGLGIDLAKHRDALFGMYKTFHTNTDAKGIGLFITKNQVESMGGDIEVTSEVGKGTVFKVYFN